MPTRSGRRLAIATALMFATVAVDGCAGASRGATGQPPRTLIINNRSSFELVIYAIPSPGSSGTRIGSAGSFATTKISVPVSVLQSGEALVLRVHTLGLATSTYDWTSPSVRLFSDVVARLDIRADSHGDVSSSVFYVSAAPDSGGTR